ncbi:MAG TPA: hypothetical protein VE594_03725 [Nitrososphaeraceae archaeon]|nr:hypothetical protein [Nitrososphaeraceae archaeon]
MRILKNHSVKSKFMKFTTNIILGLVAGVIAGNLVIALNSLNAQNFTSTNNMIISANMTDSNMTTSDTSSSSARMFLQAGIKALESGDTEAAMTNLDAAKQAMVPGPAMSHFEQGINALQNGNLNGAIMHLTAADKALLKP